MKNKFLIVVLILILVISMLPQTTFSAATVKVTDLKTLHTIYIKKGKTVTLPWIVSPNDATNKTVKWSSANKKIAIVNNKGVVKSIRAGITTVTVKTMNGKKTAKCKIHVFKKAVPVKKVSIKKGKEKGNTLQLNARITPTNATGVMIKWKSSNKKIATVDKLGKVTMRSAGKVTITATVGRKKAKLVMMVDRPTPTPTPVIPMISLEEYPKVDGSTANIPLAMALIQKVTGCTKTEAEKATQFSTTDMSYKALAQGGADILLAYEAAEDTKKDVLGYNTFQINPIGRDALVFLINKANPVKSLTTEQIRDIFSNDDGGFFGKITNWKNVGGNDVQIMPLQRQMESGSYTMMDKLVLKGRNRCGTVIFNMLDMLEAVNSNPESIGFSVYYYADIMIDLPNIELLTIDGITPSNKTIKSGAYPHVNDFFCVLPKTPTDNAKKLSDWLLSDEGQRFVEDCGYVPMR